MPIGMPVLIGAAAILAMLLASGEKKKGDIRRGPILGPIPVPGDDEDMKMIDVVICDCWESLGGSTNLATLRLCVAEFLHPDIPWAPIEGDHQTVHAVWELFTERIESFLAAPDKQAWCESGGINPIEILPDWISPTPIPGAFYMIQGGDNLALITRKALNSVVSGAGNNGGYRLEYMKCITSGPKWNWPLYASTSFSENYKEWQGINGMGLRRAFNKWHPNAKNEMLERKMPERAITLAGVKLPGVSGNSFALLWLPPVDAAHLAQGNVTCGMMDWDDGSSSIDPPPEILEMLT